MEIGKKLSTDIQEKIDKLKNIESVRKKSEHIFLGSESLINDDTDKNRWQ